MLEDELRNAIASKPESFIIVVGAGVTIGAVEESMRARASWGGLIRHGIQYASSRARTLDDKKRRELESALKLGTPSFWITAAEELAKALDARQGGGNFASWLREAVGSFEESIVDTSVLEPIALLARMGATIATVNYDGVLESVTGLHPVTWRQPNRALRVLRGEDRGILHLHGHWGDPESVVLGTSSYEDVVRDEHTRAMLAGMHMWRSMLFVGHGAGLDDPNWGSFLDWAAKVFATSEHRHYRLVLESELTALSSPSLHAKRISLVSYGKKHADLGKFLQGLVPDRPEAAGSPPGLEPSEGERPQPQEPVECVVLLVNMGEPYYDFVDKAEIERVPGLRPIGEPLEAHRIFFLKDAEARTWREVIKDIDGLLAQAQEIARGWPRPLTFVISGAAPLPVWAYMGLESERKLDGQILFANKRRGGGWDYVGPVRRRGDLPNEPKVPFEVYTLQAPRRGPGRIGIFVGCCKDHHVEHRHLTPLEATGGPINGSYRIQATVNHKAVPMTEGDLAPLLDLFEETRGLAARDHVLNPGLVLALATPAWAAFWLGRELNRNVTGPIEFPNRGGAGFVPALSSDGLRAPWVLGHPKLLVLAGEPDQATRTRAGAHIAQIRGAVGSAPCELPYEPSVRRADLLGLLRTHRPDILHVCAHGREDGTLLFEDEHGRPAPISAADFAAMLRAVGAMPSLIVLSVCFSKALVVHLLRSCDCIVVADGKVPYDGAQTFVAAFYKALAAAESVGAAFEQAQVQAKVADPRRQPPFELIPAPGVNPSAMFFWAKPT